MTGRVGKIRNIWLVWLVWPFITLGIYHLVWWYKINREARDLDADIEVNPAIAVVAITLGALIIVPPWVSIFNTGGRIAKMQAVAGVPSTCSGLLGLIASFFFGLHILYYQNELNKIWTDLGSAPEGTVVTLPQRPSAGPEGPAQAAA
jgi:DMSO/TMAO reductase YedYZ heme-binding membrane subunit